jgi:hypothetical protein
MQFTSKQPVPRTILQLHKHILGKLYINFVLTRCRSSYSFGNIYHIDNDGLDAITLALNLGTKARHLVAVECIAHTAIHIHTPHFEDKYSTDGVVPVVTAIFLATVGNPQLISVMVTIKTETTATRTWRKQRC